MPKPGPRTTYQYIADREQLAAIAIELMAPSCVSVERCWKGSQDGEAIVGFNESGEVVSMIHLDPDGIRLLNRPKELAAYLRMGPGAWRPRTQQGD